MNIEEAIKRVEEVKKEYATMDGLKDYVIAIETLLTAYEKEKQKNKEISDKLTEKICKGVEEEILEEYRQIIIDKDKLIEELKKYKKKDKK